MNKFFQTLKKDYIQNKVMINLIILSALILCSMITQIATIVTILFAIFVIGFSSIEDGFYYIIFCAPFCGAVCLFNEQIFIYTIMAAYIILNLLKKIIKKELKIKWYFALSIGLFAIYLFLPFGGYDGFKFLYAGLFLIYIFMAYCLYIIKDSINIKKFIFFAVLGLFVSAVYSAFISYIPNVNALFVKYYDGSYFRFSGLFDNPNYFAGYCALLLAVISSYIMLTKPTKSMWFQLLIVLVFGLATLSKAFLVLVGILTGCFLIHLIIKCYKNEIHKKYVPLIIGMVIILLIVFFTIFAQRYNFTKEFDINDLTTGRYEIWVYYLATLSSSVLTLLFGFGVQNIIINDNGTMSAHNIYIELLQKLGVLGMLILLALIILFFVFAITKNKNKICVSAFLPFAIFVIYGLIESMLYNAGLSILIPFVIVFPFFNLFSKDVKVQNNEKQ